MTRGVKIVEIGKKILKNFEGKRKVYVAEKYLKTDYVYRRDEKKEKTVFITIFEKNL